MDEINKIRKDFFSEGKTRNEIAKKYNRSWNTIDTIVNISREDLPNRGKRRGRRRTIITPEVISAVENLLDNEQNLHVKKKQRYTATFIYNEFKRQGIYKGTERSMRLLVAEIRQRRNTGKQQSYLPLSFESGTCIQIDHGEADCIIEGRRVTGYLFVGSLPGLSIRCCQIYPTKSKEAWGEFHEYVFRFFNGIFSTVTYDNDSVLVKKVLGTERRETNFSLGLQEHYGFESVFCNRSAGNEKGAVENAVGFCRRNYLAGLPDYSNWAELNQYLMEKCRRSISEGKHYRNGASLKELLEEAQNKLLPLVPEKQWVQWDYGKVNSYQIVAYKNHWYSVPERYVGSHVQISTGVFVIKIYKDNQLIASHPRHYVEGYDSLCLDHYLEQLSQKPGALWDCAATKKHCFESELITLWDRLYSRLDKRSANEEFIKILLLRRRYFSEDYMTAIGLALEYGAVEYPVIVNLLHQLTTDSGPSYSESWLGENLPELTDKSFHAEYDLSGYADLHKREEVQNAD